MKINAAWISESFEPPSVHKSRFAVYALPISTQAGGRRSIQAYHLADYLTVREWVREYKSGGGSAESTQEGWAGMIERRANEWRFRWVDAADDVGSENESRKIRINNVADLIERARHESAPDLGTSIARLQFALAEARWRAATRK